MGTDCGEPGAAGEVILNLQLREIDSDNARPMAPHGKGDKDRARRFSRRPIAVAEGAGVAG